MEKMNVKDFDAVYKIMEEAFPEIERRSYDGQKKLLKKEHYHIFIIKEGTTIKAFISIWEYKEFIFIEHLAIHRQFRNLGLGATLLQEVLQVYNKQAVLEVELPNTKLAIRRINFYQRLGFYKNESFFYEQPPLRKGLKFYPLLLMSYPTRYTMDALERIKNYLYQDVYEIDLYS